MALESALINHSGIHGYFLSEAFVSSPIHSSPRRSKDLDCIKVELQCFGIVYLKYITSCERAVAVSRAFEASAQLKGGANHQQISPLLRLGGFRPAHNSLVL